MNSMINDIILSDAQQIKDASEKLESHRLLMLDQISLDSDSRMLASIGEATNKTQTSNVGSSVSSPSTTDDGRFAVQPQDATGQPHQPKPMGEQWTGEDQPSRDEIVHDIRCATPVMVKPAGSWPKHWGDKVHGH